MFVGKPRGRAGRWLAGTAAALALPLISAIPGAAQQHGQIEGVIRAGGTGEPVAEVVVSVEGLGAFAVSDTRGAFHLGSVPAGRWTIVAERIGYTPVRREVTVRAGDRVRVDVELTAEVLTLSDLVVTVSGEAARRAETPATIDVLDQDAIRAARAAHPSELMSRIPGVWVNVTGGEGHMTAIRQPQTTNPVYLFLEDGVPTRSTGFFNHNALYEINLPQAERVEVLKGPATALYGSDAIGGTINVGTSAPSATPELDASIEGGAFGWGRVLLDASDTWGRDGVRVDVNLTRTDGWRDGTAYDRQAATLRWDRVLADATSLKTVAAFSWIDQATAGSSAISREDYVDRPTLNYTPISFRNVRAIRVSTELRRVGAQSLLTLTAFARDNEMEILPNWSLTYDPTVYTNGHRSIGLLAKYRRDFEPLRARVVVGADVDVSPGQRFEQAVVPTREGQIFTDYTVGSTLYDYDVTFRGVSPYIHAEISPAERFRITAGLRYDRLAYDYDNKLTHLATGSHRRPADAVVRYEHLSPKLGATYDVAPWLNVFAAYGHGFRAPSEGQIFRQGTAENTIDLRPVKANNFEAGVRGRLGERLDYELSAYHMVKEDDILSYTRADGTPETVNAGETLHRGIEVGIGAALTRELRLDVSYSRARHTYEAWSPRPDEDLGGNEMENAPREVARVGLGYAPDFLRGGRIGVDWSRIGSYWMDAANTTEYAGHDLLDVAASVPVHGRLTLFGRVSNVTDERYAERASYNRFRGDEFAPGMPRRVVLGLQFR